MNKWGERIILIRYLSLQKKNSVFDTGIGPYSAEVCFY